MIVSWVYALVLNNREYPSALAIIRVNGVPQLFEKRKDAENELRYWNKKAPRWTRVAKVPILKQINIGQRRT